MNRKDDSTNAPITVFTCRRTPVPTVKVQVNLDKKLFEKLKSKLSEKDQTTDSFLNDLLREKLG